MRDPSSAWADIARPVELRTRGLDALAARPDADTVKQVLAVLTDLQDIFTTRGSRAGAAAACFNRLYVATTAEVGERLAAGAFLAPSFICRLDVRFALRYLAAVRGMATDPSAVPRSWRVVLDPAEEASTMARMAAGVNAHINFDLPFALLAALRSAPDPTVFPAGPRDLLDLLDADDPGDPGDLGDLGDREPSPEYRDYVEVNEIFHALLPGALDFTTSHDGFLRWVYRLSEVRLDAERMIVAARRVAWLVCRHQLWPIPAHETAALRRRESGLDWLVARLGTEMLGPSGHLAFGGPQDAAA